MAQTDLLISFLTSIQIGHKLLKVGIVAQQFAAGFYQPVHLFIA
jgi:hypothetical protein